MFKLLSKWLILSVCLTSLEKAYVSDISEKETRENFHIRVHEEFDLLLDFLEDFKEDKNKLLISETSQKNIFDLIGLLREISYYTFGIAAFQSLDKNLSNAINRFDPLANHTLRLRLILLDKFKKITSKKAEKKFSQYQIDQNKAWETLIPNIYSSICKLGVGFLYLIDHENLSPSIKKLIQMSPALWPCMRGLDTEEWDHFEEAIASDVELYRNHDVEAPHTGAIYSTFYKKTITLFCTPYEAFKSNILEKKIDPLPQVDFKTLFHSGYPDLWGDKAIHQEETEVFTPVDSLAEVEVSLVPTPQDNKDMDTEAPSLPVKVQKKSQAAFFQGFPKAQAITNPHLPRNKKSTSPPKKKAASSVTVEEEEAPTLSSLPVKLTTHHQDTLRDIFDVKKLSSVTFEKFSFLWEYLGGNILATGGSHRTLKWQGKTIGGTYDPHPLPHYGKHSISHIRRALEKIGAKDRYLDTQ